MSKAYAKLNLFLHVVGKRDDGYHLLESLVAFAIDIFDEIELIPNNIELIPNNNVTSLQITGEFQHLIKDDIQNNIILKAYNKLLPYKLFPVNFTLIKNLPVAAGIGGGSSDAAITIKLLQKTWNIEFSNKEILDICLSLGADVPVCYENTISYFAGIGEVIIPVNQFPTLFVVLVNPKQTLLTENIFKENQFSFRECVYKPTSFNDSKSVINFLSNTTNDLTDFAIRKLPVIKNILESLENENALIARMSGSGPTCFGIFDIYEDALLAYNNILDKHPEWWVKLSGLQ